jgi:hypothetical protein
MGVRTISVKLSRMLVVKLLQNRHPERSASQTDRVTQCLWRGVEGPRRCLITHAARSFSTTGPATVRPGANNHKRMINP